MRIRSFANGLVAAALSMSGVWPGGGLFAIPAPGLGQDVSVYATFGLTNPDMPATVQASDAQVTSAGVSATLSQRKPAPKRAGFAGYGYEMVMVAPAHEDWPVNFLQWVVNAEIGHDAGLLARVEQYGGLTVEDIDVGDGHMIHVLIAKAQAPLPTGIKLPAGQMAILVATTITAQEMSWSQSHGRPALLKKLQDSGVGQISMPRRKSVVQ